MQKTNLNDISRALALVNLDDEPTVFIHSSLFSLGRLDFSVQELIDLLIEWIGPDGTLAMPAFSYHNDESYPWRALSTPGKTGILTECFRKSSGVLRSTHPIHSICAYGKKANYLTQDIEITSFGEKSPFSKLIQMNAVNIALGAQFVGGATFLHYVEELLRVPYRSFLQLEVEVYDMNGMKVDDDFYYFARRLDPTQKNSYVNNWDGALKDLLENNLLSSDKIGSANFMWAKMGDAINFLIQKIRADPYYCVKKILNEK